MEDPQDRSLLVLNALDALVRGDVGMPGLRGTLAIGVSTSVGPRWWAVECGKTAQGRFTHEVPSGADAALLLSERGARGLLEGADLGGEASMFGDVALLGRFLDRYLKKQSLVSVRTGRHAARAQGGSRQ
ncbi:MAG: hypothetical protein U1E65_05955 [Myxococcota bacterium]